MPRLSAYLILFLSAGVVYAADPPKAPDKPAPAVTVPGVVRVVPAETQDRPVVCPPGRFVVFLPSGDDPLTYDASEGVVEQLPPGTSVIGVKWDEPGGAKPKRYTFPEAKGHVGFFLPEADAVVSVWKNGAGGLGPVKVQTVAVKAGEGPRPPPGPTPTPTPTPPVDPSPFPGEGLRVLIVYDNENKVMTAAQNSIMFGKEVRAYLDANCAVGPDGKTREARIYPAATDVTFDAEPFKSAFARPRKSDPWILVGNGKAGYEGPLPATVEETITLLKKYGGK
ncbi:MAG: hypothetical protein ACRC7O_04520 [Fimbriiglobus sp.]